MAGLQVNAGRDFSRNLGDTEIDRRGLGLIKPSISTAARARDEGMSKLFDDGAYAHQRLNLGTKGEGSWTKYQGFKPDLRNSVVRHYRGASGNAALVEL